jgi:3-methyladenine DNA glycosylase AlkD
VSGTSKLSPREAAEDMIDRVRRKADPKRAASTQRYFKEPVECYGLDTATGRALTKKLLKQVKGSWTLRDALAFCRSMARDPHLEPRGIGYQVVAAFVGEAGPGLLRDAKRWLERSCGNWALVDNLAPSVVAPLVKAHPEAIPEVVGWTASSNMWLRRGAAVTFVPLARRGQHLDTVYDVARRLLGDREDLMHKAVGWLLREAGKADRRRLEQFLRAEGSRIPRTTVRYAIERFPPDERHRWLEATR